VIVSCDLWQRLQDWQCGIQVGKSLNAHISHHGENDYIQSVTKTTFFLFLQYIYYSCTNFKFFECNIRNEKICNKTCIVFRTTPILCALTLPWRLRFSVTADFVRLTNYYIIIIIIIINTSSEYD